jgi:hypothetical protein
MPVQPIAQPSAPPLAQNSTAQVTNYAPSAPPLEGKCL